MSSKSTLTRYCWRILDVKLDTLIWCSDWLVSCSLNSLHFRTCAGCCFVFWVDWTDFLHKILTRSDSNLPGYIHRVDMTYAGSIWYETGVNNIDMETFVVTSPTFVWHGHCAKLNINIHWQKLLWNEPVMLISLWSCH